MIGVKKWCVMIKVVQVKIKRVTDVCNNVEQLLMARVNVVNVAERAKRIVQLAQRVMSKKLLL